MVILSDLSQAIWVFVEDVSLLIQEASSVLINQFSVKGLKPCVGVNLQRIIKVTQLWVLWERQRQEGTKYNYFKNKQTKKPKQAFYFSLNTFTFLAVLRTLYQPKILLFAILEMKLNNQLIFWYV